MHKAPANEVVRGIIGLQRILNKEQHDILNPYPVNINVIRDFRETTAASASTAGGSSPATPDWKYVNVRRLLIFIEASIDRGLQWVVFEPNAEPLWARVRRSIPTSSPWSGATARSKAPRSKRRTSSSATARR